MTTVFYGVRWIIVTISHVCIPDPGLIHVQNVNPLSQVDTLESSLRNNHRVEMRGWFNDGIQEILPKYKLCDSGNLTIAKLWQLLQVSLWRVLL